MARKPKSEESHDTIIDSSRSIEENARLVEEMGRQVTDHLLKHHEDAYKKLNKALEKNLTPLQAALDEFEEAAKAAQGASGQKQSFMDDIKTNLIKNTGAGKKFDPSGANFGKMAVAEITKGLGKFLSGALDTYLMKPFKTALSDMESAYESNFTNIAGRMGSDRKATHDLMHSAVKQLADSQYSAAINANKELIPALNKAADMGFKGNQAISVAMSNSIDSKIMPWLETSSAAWANLQFNLSEGQVKSLKAQQLLLQESQSGNRLLQSGIINKIDADLTPILTNIDYNTMDKDKLPAETKALMEAMVDKGMSEDQAYAEAQRMVQIYRDPTQAFRSGGSAADILAAEEVAVKGGDLIDAFSVYTDFANELASYDTLGAGLASDALYGGAATNGGRRAEDYAQRGSFDENELRKRTDEIMAADASDYNSIANKAAEKVTATAAYDNKLQNDVSSLLYGANGWAHGMDLLQQGVNILSNIAGSLAGGAINMLGGKFITKQIGKKLASTAGEEVAEKATKEGLEAVAEKGGKKISTELGEEVAETAGKKVVKEVGEEVAESAGKTVLKKAGKFIPFAGNALAITDGLSTAGRAIQQGNLAAGLLGGIEAATGALGFVTDGIPVVGTVVDAIGAVAGVAGELCLAFQGAGEAATDKEQADQTAALAARKAADELRGIKAAEKDNAKVNSLASSMAASWSEAGKILKDEGATEEELEKVKALAVKQGLLTATEASNMSRESLLNALQPMIDAGSKMESRAAKYTEAEGKIVGDKMTGNATLIAGANGAEVSLNKKVLAQKESGELAADQDISATTEGERLKGYLIDSANDVMNELYKQANDYKAAGDMDGYNNAREWANKLLEHRNAAEDGMTADEADAFLATLRDGAFSGYRSSDDLVKFARKHNVDNYAVDGATSIVSQDELLEQDGDTHSLAQQIDTLWATRSSYEKLGKTKERDATDDKIAELLLKLPRDVDQRIKDAAHNSYGVRYKIATINDYIIPERQKKAAEGLIEDDPSAWWKKNIPEYRVGIQNVPYDRLALLHQGESVWTASQTSNVARITSSMSQALVNTERLVNSINQSSENWINLDHILSSRDGYMPLADTRLDQVNVEASRNQSQTEISTVEIVNTIVTQTNATNKLLAEIKAAMPSAASVLDKMRSGSSTADPNVIRMRPTIGLYKPI